MIRILHIVGAMYPGGLENFIMNLYEEIDRSQYQFDFAVHLRKDGDYGDLIESMGGHIYELPRLTTHPVKSLVKLYRLVKKNHYKIVIRHTANALVSPQLLAARMAGAKTICHSHNETDPQKGLHKLGRLLLPLAATERMACSPKAGQWMFGKAPFTEIHNAIHIEKFAYDEEKGKKIEQEFSAAFQKNRRSEEKRNHIYGHIANFIASKNHMFLLEVFAEIKKLDSSAVFFCLGEGDLRSQIEAKRKELGLEDCVILTGIRKDVENFMSCMDVLIFPSFFEGLPLTLIEAQAAGLPMLISDTITKDVVVTEGLVHWESLQTSAKEWAKKTVSLVENNIACSVASSAEHSLASPTKTGKTLVSKENYRACQVESITKAGYNMKNLVQFYENYFKEMVE